MITLKEFMEVCDYRITEGDTYGWRCYGNHAYMLSSWNGIHGTGGFSLNIVFSTKSQRVFEVEICDYTNDRAYRFINPKYRKKYLKEAKTRGESASQAWDDVNYIDLEVAEDFLEKARAIVKGIDYDSRVKVPVNFSDEELFQYMKIAHERDMTFNQLVEEALVAAIEEFKLDPEGMKARALQWKEEND